MAGLLNKNFKNAIMFFLTYTCMTSLGHATPLSTNNFKWGETEFISLDGEKINKKELLKDMPSKIYSQKSAESLIEENFNWCEVNLKKKLPLHKVNCGVEFNNEEKVLNFLISMARVQKAVEPAKKISSTLLLNPELLQLLYWYNGRIPYSKKEQVIEKLNQKVPKNKKHLLEVIATGKYIQDREAAVELLSFAEIKRQDINWLIEKKALMYTPELISVFEKFFDLVDPKQRRKFFKEICASVSNLEYNQRNLSLSVVYKLLKMEPSLKRDFDKRTRHLVEYLYFYSVMRETRERADRIIKLLS